MEYKNEFEKRFEDVKSIAMDLKQLNNRLLANRSLLFVLLQIDLIAIKTTNIVKWHWVIIFIPSLIFFVLLLLNRIVYVVSINKIKSEFNQGMKEIISNNMENNEEINRIKELIDKI